MNLNEIIDISMIGITNKVISGKDYKIHIENILQNYKNIDFANNNINIKNLTSINDSKRVKEWQNLVEKCHSISNYIMQQQQSQNKFSNYNCHTLLPKFTHINHLPRHLQIHMFGGHMGYSHIFNSGHTHTHNVRFAMPQLIYPNPLIVNTPGNINTNTNANLNETQNTKQKSQAFFNMTC